MPTLLRRKTAARRGKPGARRKAAPPTKTCAAVLATGRRCGHRPATGSKYCGTHRAFRPKGTGRKVLESLRKARGMKAIRGRAKKSRGGRGPIRDRPAARRLLGTRRRS